MKKQSIAVALSGGVDSLCALLLLRAQGHDVAAVHGIFLEEALEGAAPLREICACLDIPFHCANLGQLFDARVIAPFARAWAAGETPNPCVICNRAIKFGALFDFAMSLGADKFATGHYAGIAQGPAGPLIERARCGKKDQSYFLGLVPRERLGRLLFPLSELDKDFCRAYVRRHGIEPPATKESQDICFIGAGSCQSFLDDYWRSHGQQAGKPGVMLIAGKTVGRHGGLWNYTVGQRKGLGIAHVEPLYVTGKDYSANALILGPRAELGMSRIVAGKVNFFSGPELWPERVFAKFRHGGEPVPAKAVYDGEFMIINLESPQFPTARGQLAAIYDVLGRMLAAGIVRTTENRADSGFTARNGR